MVTFIGYISNSHFKQRKKVFSLFEMSYRIGSNDPLVTDLFINKLKKMQPLSILEILLVILPIFLFRFMTMSFSHWLKLQIFWTIWTGPNRADYGDWPLSHSFVTPSQRQSFYDHLQFVEISKRVFPLFLERFWALKVCTFCVDFYLKINFPPII